MISSENIDLIMSGQAHGPTLVDAKGVRHMVVGHYDGMRIDLKAKGFPRVGYHIVTSGPRIEFYANGVKHEALSSPDAYFVQDLTTGQ